MYCNDKRPRSGNKKSPSYGGFRGYGLKTFPRYLMKFFFLGVSGPLGYHFSKEKGKPTITPKMPGVKRLGQRKALSKTDCLKVNDLYGCLTKNIFYQRKYYTICQNLGI